MDAPSGPVRELLLLIGAELERDEGAAGVDADLVLRAAEAAGLDAGVLENAEAAGLVRLDGGRLRCTDPRLPRHVYTAAPRAPRRSAHRLLAAACEGDPHALPALYHRASSTESPAPGPADELAAAAAEPGVRRWPVEGEGSGAGEGGPRGLSALYQRAASVAEGPASGAPSVLRHGVPVAESPAAGVVGEPVAAAEGPGPRRWPVDGEGSGVGEGGPRGLSAYQRGPAVVGPASGAAGEPVAVPAGPGPCRLPVDGEGSAVREGGRRAPSVSRHGAFVAGSPASGAAGELVAAAAEPGSHRWPSHRERSAAYARAAELTADQVLRGVRLTAAAEHARLGGLPHRARELLAAAGPEGLPDAARGAAELVRGRLALHDGPVADARETLLLAAELLTRDDPPLALTARLAATEAAWAMGDARAYLEALGHPASRTGPAPADRELASYRAGMAEVMQGRLGAGRVPLGGVVADGTVTAGDDPVALLRTGVAALVVGDLPAACRVNSRALALARARGTYVLVSQALEHLAYGELRAGRHARARAHAEEGLRAALDAGQHNIAAHQHAILALAASVEGDPESVAEHAAAAERVAAPHGLTQAATLAQWARARADLGRGRVPEAAARLGPLVGPGPRSGHFAVRMLAVPCFVEAAARAGQAAAARSAVAEFAVWAGQGADPQAPAQLARCRALLSGPEECEPLFTAALACHDRAGGDFERGRTQLLYGAWLRRRRRPGEARGRLRDALVSFERGGAAGWAEQTRAELRATGEATEQEPPGPLALLTPQQLRIARCVAEGATNREVALHLSVSPRTVDHHLRNVFAVLGVRSRVELSRLVDRAGETAAPL
ncbi:LuxR C-terminal-related transcriptional regulator [Streptomyces sp. NPDC059785]|uniref:helix-turn-helix transcriptional regulator n=1 Tax=Streptomyces sp. NPDC059785 TaxID=3346945 RepID=UPI003653FDB1